MSTKFSKYFFQILKVLLPNSQSTAAKLVFFWGIYQIICVFFWKKIDLPYSYLPIHTTSRLIQACLFISSPYFQNSDFVAIERLERLQLFFNALRLRAMKNTYPAASSNSGRTASPIGVFQGSSGLVGPSPPPLLPPPIRRGPVIVE